MHNRLILFVIIAFLSGIILGRHFTVPQERIASTAGSGDIRNLIHQHFYKPVPDKKLQEAGIKGMLKTLNDPYSHYFTPKDYQTFRESVERRFTGIGVIVVPHKKGLEVGHVFKTSPAKQAGIRAGDVITKAGGKALKGLSAERATDRIRGPENTKAHIIIERNGKALAKAITRKEINIPVIEQEMEGNYAHVMLRSFSPDVHAELRRTLETLEKKNPQGLVLDLRGNGGGLLEEAVNVTGLFQKGKVVSIQGRHREKREYRSSQQPMWDKPVVVLVDKASASASEIVAGALQESGRATVVGMTTFGKGVVQETFRFANGSAVNLTVAEYRTPKGRSLGGKGVTPKVKSKDDPKTKADEALQRALAILKR